MVRFIGFLALAGLVLIGGFGTLPTPAATPDGAQLAQAAPRALPAEVAARLATAIKSGDSQALAATISELIAADPSLANAIVMFAVAQAPSAAPTIAVAAAKAVQAQGGDPVQVAQAVVAALEAQVQPAAGGGGSAGGAGGGLTDAQVAGLVRTVVANVADAVTLSANQVAALGNPPAVNQVSQNQSPVVPTLPVVTPPPATNPVSTTNSPPVVNSTPTSSH